ncbi:hypothetical protein CEUSTIGMA_g7440.t1 [Chlamydomonas eustigma]|uniref:t-SNARE coiled-coil homology domain-containing protein n=1 Tax=Chlamydomonas eustigma TaxID=1157962 RepID=A0A250XB52_9CHLO|nr:hypothetical protein CEUSTIGMA_g7440.t1 [Chlamydomonas eustigma]|eukprot:GAX80000.1 hypothetical protein CEUSTIGMA_g7440.t1 [Chlamydomonas eustigma]
MATFFLSLSTDFFKITNRFNMATPESLPELPAPRSDLLPEIHFRRLLHSCVRIIKSAHLSRDIDTGALNLQSAKLKHYINTLQDQLGDLERNYAIDLGFSTLTAYKRHVAALAAFIPQPELPSYFQKPKPNQSLQIKGLPTFLPQPFVPGSQNVEDMSSGRLAQTATSASTAMTHATQKRLEHQEQLQDAITDDLVGMAAALKKSTLDMQAAVDRRGDLVNAAETNLVKSLDNAKEVVSKSKEQFKRGKGTCCLTCMVLLVVCIVLSAMIVYIKFTHLLGYRLPLTPVTQKTLQIASPQLHVPSDYNPSGTGAGSDGEL